MSEIRKSDRKRKEPERLVYETAPVVKRKLYKKKSSGKVLKIGKKVPVKVLKRSGVKVAAPIKKTKKVAIKKAKANAKIASVATTKGKRLRVPPLKKQKTTSTPKKTTTKKPSGGDLSDEEIEGDSEVIAGSKKKKKISPCTKICWFDIKTITESAR